MDTKGLGRPEVFDNKEESFRRWIRTINNLVAGVFGPDYDKVLESCLDSEDPIDLKDLAENEHPDVDGIDRVGGQLYRVLCHLCTGESEDLLVGAGNGDEAYRKLCRRWDPAASGRKRNLLWAILNPERCKTWAAVRPAIEQLEDLVRRYEARRSASGVRELLSDDIKSASLELLVPTDLEKHLTLNKNRLTSYGLMKQDIELVVESSVGSKGSVTRPGQASSSSGPQPMDVDAVTQWIASLVKGQSKGKGKGKSKGKPNDSKQKGKGKGKGKDGKGSGSNNSDIVCHNCGKKGHKAVDCWSKKRDQGKGNQKGNSKGKKHVKKHVSGLEHGESAEAGAEPAPEADVGLFDVGAIDGKVCTPVAVSSAEEWVKFNLDTGAAQTAVPKDRVNDKVTVTGASEMSFKTAPGELVPSEGTGTFEGFGESGMRCRVRGAIADAHKPLVSAHKCLGFGRIAVLDENGGQLVPVNSKAGRAIQGIINRSTAAEAKTWLPVYQEKGISREKVESGNCSPLRLTKELNAASDGREARADPAEGATEEVMEEAEESERPKLVKSPDTPPQAEIDEHEAMGHVVYRDWCRHCIAGRAIGQHHRTRTEEQRARNLVPTIVLDYAVMSRSDEDDERLRPILVMKDEKTQMVAATFVDSKGATPFAVKFAAAFLKNLGYRKVVLKSDGEHSIVALKEAAATKAAIESVPEESPVGDRRANGLAEKAIREVKRQIRVLRSALEESIGRALSDEDPVLAWLPRKAADLLCRYKKGTDGRTPEVRRSGKQWRKPAIAFGERLYFREVGEGTRVLKEGRYALVSTAAPEACSKGRSEETEHASAIVCNTKGKSKDSPSVSEEEWREENGISATFDKAKPAPAQGVKRTAEEGAEVSENRTTAEQAVVSTAGAEGVVTTPEAPEAAQDLRSAVKSVAMENIKSSVEETYKKNNIEITAQEISDIASLSCEMAATDIAEIYSPKRFTALAQQYKLRPGFAVDLCETMVNIGT
eukprot:s12_g2.t1